MATAYVLIDFENVQPKELGAFGGRDFKVKVFIGPSQPTIPVGLATAVQALGHAGSYIQIEGRGPNALDMHIAYYIGRFAATDPGASFHIISRDRDYDPLILHLKSQGISCTRWKSVAEIDAVRGPAVKAAPKTSKTAAKTAPKAPARAAKTALKVATKPASGRIDGVIQNLEKRAMARPATMKALTSTIKALYRGIADAEVLAIIEELKLRGVVVVAGDKVTYQLS